MTPRSCYLDTSALVKLYVDEDQSEHVAMIVGGAPRVAISRLAYPAEGLGIQ
ncbi:MAG: hypothetical protein AMXMBFR64_50550 [Myxococcales bacterium]